MMVGEPVGGVDGALVVGGMVGLLVGTDGSIVGCIVVGFMDTHLQ